MQGGSENDVPALEPASAEEWRFWIEQRREQQATVFKADPDRLTSDFHREGAHRAGYHGREVVELLQNADDAGEATTGGNVVAIALDEFGLCVANSGAVFSAEGVKSLMIADNSPKRIDRARFIGNKGLGFRSVLSWTECPIVLSGALELVFSRAHAEAWLETLCAQDDGVYQRVLRERPAAERAWPIPVLGVPQALDVTVENYLAEMYGRAVAETIRNARRLRGEGFDTVVALPFVGSGAAARQESVDQLRHIGRDALLFTRHLRSLRIDQTGSPTKTWKVERSDAELMLTAPDGHVGLWKVSSAYGEIPSDFWVHSHAKPPMWEIKLAVPEEPADMRGFLYCYFPTQVRFPFPVVAHATVELTPNRQNLVTNTENRFVLKRLAAALSDLALASRSDSDPWSGLRIAAVMEGGQADPALLEMGFARSLRDDLRARPLVPTRSSGFHLARNARRTDKDYTDWLPLAGHKDVCPWTDDPSIQRALTELEVPVLSAEEIARRLEANTAHLVTAERANVVAGFRSSNMVYVVAPAILVDQRESPINRSDVSFLPPSEGWKIDLPPWMALRFLDGNLVSELRRALSVETVRDLSTRLKPWNVKEYALASIAAQVAARLQERLRSASPAEGLSSRKAALSIFFHLYKASPKSARPEDLRIEVPTLTNSWASANEVYFGPGYADGLVSSALFGQAPAKLVAEASSIVPGERVDDIARFLDWSGVRRYPKSVHAQCSFAERGYQEYVARRLRYPADLGDVPLRDPHEARACSIACTSVEDLDLILQAGAPEAILAWLGEDSRFDAWEKEGDSTFEVWLAGRQKWRRLRGQYVPAFVPWKIATTPWMRDAQGKRHSPSRCLQGTGRSELQRVLPSPEIREHPSLVLGARPKQRLKQLLERAGVMKSLADLSIEDALDIVCELPTLDPSGSSARAVYREVTGRDRDDRPEDSFKASYLERARLRGIVGDASAWFRVGELYYDDHANAPASIRRQLPLLDLESRRGARKVADVLGVRPLENLRLSVTSVSLDPRHHEVNDALSALRPFILALARSEDAKDRFVGLLREMTVQLCRSAAGTALISGKEFEFQLGAPGERILDGSSIYLQADGSGAGASLQDPVFADRLGLAVATVLRADIAADVARLFTCAKQRRVEFLAQICSLTVSEATETIRSCAERLEMPLDAATDEHSFTPSIPPVPPSQHLDPANAPGDDLDSDASAIDASPSAEGTVVPHPPSAVSAISVTREVPAPARRILMQVKATPCKRDTRVTQRERVAVSGEYCEHLVELFEIAEGRFPLRVGHLTGEQAPGCDVISFRCADDREAFKNNALLVELVERFVEVKGRSHQHGVIDLRGNELKRAREFGERYWIYRIYEREEQSFEFLLLRDPTAGSVREVLEIDIPRSPMTVEFLVEGVDKPS